MAAQESTQKQSTGSLRTSIMLFVCGLIILASLVFSAANIGFTIMNARKDTARMAMRYAEAYSILTQRSHATGNPINVETIGQSEEVAKTIQSLVILDGDLNPLLEIQGPERIHREVRAAIDHAESSSEPIGQFQNGGYLIARPIWSDGERISVVALKVPIEASGFSVLNSLLWSFGTACLVCALAIPLAIFLIHRVTDPLRRLTAFASGISVNQLSSRVEVNAGNEFDTLGQAFNSMMDRVETTMKQVQRLAFMDSITGLPNRENFMRHLNKALQSRTDDCFSAVIIFNVDRFRWVNETLGPENGDEALALIGMRIRKSLYQADKTVRLMEAKGRPSIVARLGGDEFAVLVPNIDAKSDITRLMQMVISSMRQPLQISGQSITLGLSGGIALAPIHGVKAEELLKNADLALKEARRAGRGKARFYSTKLNKIAMDRLHLEADLRRAIEREEFVPFFQPKVCFKTGVIAGAEALVRWQRSDGDLISPGIFIPMAEQLGLISKIGETVLRQSCHQASRWMKSGHDCKVAVNVSPLQFEEQDFSEKVFSALRESDLPPGRLELEITETMAVGDTDRVTEIMRPLRAMGVRLAIDDFGAGHSNLVTLTRLPFDVFKIDQQFVSALHSDKQAPAIVEMILAMAQTMGLESVAEGVETPSQSDFLRRRNCTLAQGYLYSKPLPPEEFLTFLEEWRPFGEVVDADFISHLNSVA